MKKNKDKVREKIENILREQFVSRGYNANGNTSWGVLENTEKLYQLFQAERERIIKLFKELYGIDYYKDQEKLKPTQTKKR